MAIDMKIGPRERALLIILGVVVALALVFVLFLRGGDETPQAGEPFVPGRGTPVPTVSPAPTMPPETTEVFEGKDPFKPLIEAGAPGGGTGNGDGGNGGFQPGPGTGTPTPGPTGGTRTGTRVELMDIFMQEGTRFASVKVGGEIHHVKEGDTFAGNYRVVSLTDECGTFVLGDERFTLCIGQEVFK
ncbi:MAG TPA: hypothetical protein VM841_00065 [Actinomycetota bacterium]|nr:hypothetical protein [Actinomycetota bacterium]